MSRFAEPLGLYNGPPTELRSGDVEFTKIESREYLKDFYTWRYRDGRT
jgi:hypothetical protein